MNSGKTAPRLSTAAAIGQFQSRAQYCFSLDEFCQLTGREPGSAKARLALARLQSKGVVCQLAHRSGCWLVVPPEHQARGAPPVSWWLHDYLSRKEEAYYVALLSAAQLHGSSHFAVMETQVCVPASRRPFTVGQSRLKFIFKETTAITPCVMMPTEKSRLRVSSVAATLLDLLRHADVVGGVDRIALIGKDLFPKLGTEDLKGSLEVAGDVAAAQRLGYLLEAREREKSAKVVERWLHGKRAQLVRLDTSSKEPGGPRSTRWNVTINASLETTA